MPIVCSPMCWTFLALGFVVCNIQQGEAVFALLDVRLDSRGPCDRAGLAFVGDEGELTTDQEGTRGAQIFA